MRTVPDLSVISIGVFDAVHQGHRGILSTAKRLADQHAASLVVLAFDPHPAAILRPESLPPRLASAQEKQELLKKAGADRVVLLTPSADLFKQSPETFIRGLVQAYHPVALVEGSDFRFGHQRSGNIQTLRQLGTQYGYRVVVQPQAQVMLSDQTTVAVSSSLIRWLVGRGRVADASRCLGRHYCLTAPVIHGEARGRTLGVPTINLDVSTNPDKLIPADGVYACLAILPDGSVYPAAASVGTKPTFGQSQLAVEAYLLGFSGDLYDQVVTLQFARWVRDQLTFPDIGSLKMQLDSDIRIVRQWFEIGALQTIHAPSQDALETAIDSL